MPYISSDRRKAIVYRINGGTSVVQASALKDGEELAYAMRFLIDHFVYKRSKSTGTVNASAVQEAYNALLSASGTFVKDVADPQGIALDFPTLPATPEPISHLGSGEIINPYNFAGHGE
jgi:hypothetical protein